MEVRDEIPDPNLTRNLFPDSKYKIHPETMFINDDGVVE